MKKWNLRVVKDLLVSSMEKAMAPHSSGRLQSMGLLRVGHD